MFHLFESDDFFFLENLDRNMRIGGLMPTEHYAPEGARTERYLEIEIGQY